MALTEIQKDVMAAIAANRSDSSYLAGGAVLSMDWPRLSDNIDIFQDADEEIDAAAQVDIATLRAAGFIVTTDVRVFGCVEASVMRAPEATLIQWMSESRTRFFAGCGMGRPPASRRFCDQPSACGVNQNKGQRLCRSLDDLHANVPPRAIDDGGCGQAALFLTAADPG